MTTPQPVVNVFAQDDITAVAGMPFEAITGSIPAGRRGSLTGPIDTTANPPAPRGPNNGAPVLHLLTQPLPGPVQARAEPYNKYHYNAEFITPQDGSAKLPDTMFEITMDGVTQHWPPPPNAFVNNNPPVRIATKAGQTIPETGGTWWVRMTAYPQASTQVANRNWADVPGAVAQFLEVVAPNLVQAQRGPHANSYTSPTGSESATYFVFRVPYGSVSQLGQYRLQFTAGTQIRHNRYIYRAGFNHIGDDSSGSTPRYAYYQVGVATHHANTVVTLQRGTQEATDGSLDPYRYTGALKVDPQDSYSTVFRIIAPGRQEHVLNWIRWRDPVQERSPIRHDFGHTRALLMSLPAWASRLQLEGQEIDEAGDHIHNAGIVIGNEQWLVIDNIQEMILPVIESKQQPKLIETVPINYYGGQRYESSDPNTNLPQSDDLPDDVTDLPVTAAYQSGAVIGKAIVRVLWNNEYLSHGGQYGVRVMGMTRFPPPQWLYYIKPHWNETTDRWTRGQVLLQWQGFISKFTERVTQEGIFVDFEITPESAPALPFQIQRTPPPEGRRLRSHNDWPLRPDNRNFPSIEWPQVYF